MLQCSSSPSGSMPRKVRASTGPHDNGTGQRTDNADPTLLGSTCHEHDLVDEPAAQAA